MSSVLCVDDEPSVGAILQETLTLLGHEPILATSVDEALTLLESHPIDIVLSDYKMPEKSGFDLLDVLRERGSDVPVIILTGYTSQEHGDRALEKGAIEFCTKPIRVESLRISIKQALAVASLRRRNREMERELDRVRSTAGRQTGDPVTVRPETPTEPSAPSAEDPADSDEFNLKIIEKATIRRALVATGGHRSRAAKMLGISERTLRNKIKTLAEKPAPTSR